MILVIEGNFEKKGTMTLFFASIVMGCSIGVAWRHRTKIRSFAVGWAWALTGTRL